MIRSFAIAACCYLSVVGVAGVASAQTYSPPIYVPSTTYVLPPVVVDPSDYLPPYLLYEGRSVRLGDPGAFYNSPDEMGYPTGLPQNPRHD